MFFQFFNLYFFNSSNPRKLESFVFQRLTDDCFYDEGSSFYHVGVILSLIRLKKFSNNSSFSPEFNIFLDNASQNLSVLNLINFGDRDDTYIGENIQHFKTPDIYLDNKCFFINSCKRKHAIFFVRKNNRTDFGTEVMFTTTLDISRI